MGQVTGKVQVATVLCLAAVMIIKIMMPILESGTRQAEELSSLYPHEGLWCAAFEFRRSVGFPTDSFMRFQKKAPPFLSSKGTRVAG